MSSRRDRKRALAAARAQVAAARRRRHLIATMIVVAAVVLASAGTGAAIWATQRHSAEATGFPVPKGASRALPGVAISQGPITVDVYFDFLCGECKEFHTLAGGPLNSYTSAGQIRLVYHPLNYLDDKSDGSRFSTRAGAAAGCAADAGQLPAFLDAVFGQQPKPNTEGLTNAQLVKAGTDAGITGSSFRTCVTSQRYADWVAAVSRQATDKGIDSAPAVFVDNSRIDATATALTTAINNAQ